MDLAYKKTRRQENKKTRRQADELTRNEASVLPCQLVPRQLVPCSLLISAVISLTACAGDFVSGGLVFSLTGHHHEVAVDQNIVDGLNAYEGIYIIPGTVNYDGENYRVAAIADGAFSHSKVTEVVIPNSVTHIGKGAFAYADDLTDVTLPLGIAEVPDFCFAGTSIVNIVLPEGVKDVGRSAFQDCAMLHTVMLPSSLKYIDDYAFDGCHNLYEIYCAATEAPITLGDNTFGSVKGVDLVVADNETIDSYGDDTVWGNDSTFTIFPNEDFYPTMELNGESFNQDWKRITLGNNLAYKIYDESDELVAITSATHLYLPAMDHNASYTVVPTTLMFDSDPFTVTVDKTTGIKEFIDDTFPAEPEPIIVAHFGIIYVYADTYKRWTSVWDMSGRLYYQRISSDSQIIDLPRNRVYIVKVGNFVKKIRI